MLRSILSWLKEAREWSRDHRASWAPVTIVDAEGFSAFQRGTEVRVRDVLQRRGLQLVDRRVVHNEGDGDNSVTATIPALQAEIWMHRDQTDISTPRATLCLEQLDARTPAEHYAKVVRFLESLPVTRGAGD